MEALAYSLNAVLPLVLLSFMGYLLKRLGVIHGAWAAMANKLNFRLFLPVLLFMNLYTAESIQSVNWKLAAVAGCVLAVAFGLGWLTAKFFAPRREWKGVLWQAAFRSNFALLGMPLALALYGKEAGQAAAFLSIIQIPMFNILSVVSLQAYSGDGDKPKLRPFVLSVLKNPLILGVFAGLIVLLLRSRFVDTGVEFRLKDVTFLYTALNNLSQVASPLSLIALGAQFSFKATRGYLRPVIAGAVMKLAIIPIIGLGAALVMGFRGAEFAAMIALFGSPTAVSSVVMASEMGGDAELAGQLLFWTTLLSSVTIFLFVTAFRMAGVL